MVNLEQILYIKVKDIMSTWVDEDIYAVSFFVYSNEAYFFRNFDNITEFSISYNTEADCQGAGIHSEKRWNYAFWRQNDCPIIEADDNCPETQLLFDWYREQGIENIGDETYDCENGPVGYKELVDQVARVARRLQDEGFLKQKFGRPIPIIIHDLEYCDCTLRATEYANPNGEAADFLQGNWESEEQEYDVPAFIQESIASILNDPQKREQMFAQSPWLPRDLIEKAIKNYRK